MRDHIKTKRAKLLQLGNELNQLRNKLNEYQIQRIEAVCDYAELKLEFEQSTKILDLEDVEKRIEATLNKRKRVEAEITQINEIMDGLILVIETL